jgi:hypothetical protein
LAAESPPKHATGSPAKSAAEPPSKQSATAAFEGRFPINAGITGYVAATGESVNILDAYKDDRFDQSVDEGAADGFRHRTILAMPIKYLGGDQSGRRVLGVFQLINKVPRTALWCNVR